MKLFTEMATHCINKTISTNGFEILPDVIRQHTNWDYACHHKTTGCSMKPTFCNMPYRNSFLIALITELKVAFVPNLQSR